MKSKIGCLLIHGFGGNPGEVEPLAQFLENKGIATMSPALKGHTGKKADMRGVSYRQWIASAREALNELSKLCDHIFIIGFSMGGLVAVSLPFTQQIKGIVLLNTPIYPWNLKRIFLNLVSDVKNGSFKHFKFYALSAVKFPLSALFEFLKFLHNAKPQFKNLRCPLFIGQALRDDVVQPKSAEYIYKHAASVKKIIRYYSESNHLICHSPAAAKLFEDILSFIIEYSA